MNKTKQYYEAFEICLNQVFSGVDTVEDVVVQYPEFADQLKPELEAALWIYTRREAIKMRPGYLAASRQRMVNQIKQEGQDSKLQKKKTWGWQQVVFRFTFAALFILISVLTFTGGSQAINASLPGDRLYNVKLAAEDLQLSLVSDTSTEAELRIALADKRAKEAANLLEQGRYEDADIALEGYKKNLSIAADLVKELEGDPTRKIELAQKLASTMAENNEIFAVFVTVSEIPGETTSILSAIVVLNDEITQTIVVIFEEFDDSTIPVQETLTVTSSTTPTSTPTQTPSSTPTFTLTASPEASETPTSSVTPTLVSSDTPTIEPSDTPAPSNTPAPSKTPIPVQPTDDDSDDPEPTKKPTKTPKPEKPTKTPKDK